MGMLITVILFCVGILFVVKGGDFFVDAASWIAEVSGIPKLIMGATVVSIATTLPEMLVSVIAATKGQVDMSIGNAVGSVTANLGLIMAIAVFCMPGVVKRADYFLKSILMLIASAIIVICGFSGQISIVFCVILLGIFVVFMWENISEARKNVSERKDIAEKKENITQKTVISNIIKFVVGAAGIVIGAELLVDNGSELARMFGISERIIGVTLVAVGTSLPELITTITAIAKKESALSVGNILGANIMDLTLIMPLSSLISGQALPVARAAAFLDLPACMLVGLIATVPMFFKSKFTKGQGVCLFLVYAVYLVLTCMSIFG